MIFFQFYMGVFYFLCSFFNCLRLVALSPINNRLLGERNLNHENTMLAGNNISIERDHYIEETNCSIVVKHENPVFYTLKKVDKWTGGSAIRIKKNVLKQEIEIKIAMDLFLNARRKYKDTVENINKVKLELALIESKIVVLKKKINILNDNEHNLDSGIENYRKKTNLLSSNLEMLNFKIDKIQEFFSSKKAFTTRKNTGTDIIRIFKIDREENFSMYERENMIKELENLLDERKGLLDEMEILLDEREDLLNKKELTKTQIFILTQKLNDKYNNHNEHLKRLDKLQEAKKTYKEIHKKTMKNFLYIVIRGYFNVLFR
ncbi:hypothetical protein EDEG_03913 [Edhazardia aedis USNM 41457]|uniref:Uncharacterized protein n=1 Tax=Edhazardia aedis (strain USNM 41457) TaxID=1003232 RepID=J8ZP70_EDHAE|nr:hypothetical protein EDEG_03913 [Edhazardia aedis USNM 41457]|eukprot:EJW01508.1 hypothetical protein EDEG_03913 [Edhazardia aedis USNM 41457]